MQFYKFDTIKKTDNAVTCKLILTNKILIIIDETHIMVQHRKVACRNVCNHVIRQPQRKISFLTWYAYYRALVITYHKIYSSVEIFLLLDIISMVPLSTFSYNNYGFSESFPQGRSRITTHFFSRWRERKREREFTLLMELKKKV